MSETLKEMIFQAALQAGREMGPDIKGLSCFISNWPEMRKAQAGVVLASFGEG